MENKRKFERVHFLADAEVLALASRIRFAASVTSLGRGGVGLFTEGFLEVGTAIELTLHWKSPKGQAFNDKLTATVVSSQVGIDGNTLGVQFTTVLGPQHKALLEYMRRVQQSEA